MLSDRPIGPPEIRMDESQVSWTVMKECARSILFAAPSKNSSAYWRTSLFALLALLSSACGHTDTKMSSGNGGLAWEGCENICWSPCSGFSKLAPLTPDL